MIPWDPPSSLWRTSRFARPAAEKSTLTVSDRIQRGLEYGVRTPFFYGKLRKQTGEDGFPQIPTGSLCCSYRNIRKSPETSGSLRENVI